MNTTESLGYLKGLLDGLDFDADKKDTKMFKAIVEVLENIIQDIDDDLAEVEDYLAECDECGCEDCEDCEDGEYAVTCPACGEEFTVDEDTVMEGGIECPACGEFLEFELDGDDQETENDTEE